MEYKDDDGGEYLVVGPCEQCHILKDDFYVCVNGHAICENCASSARGDQPQPTSPAKSTDRLAASFVTSAQTSPSSSGVRSGVQSETSSKTGDSGGFKPSNFELKSPLKTFMSTLSTESRTTPSSPEAPSPPRALAQEELNEQKVQLFCAACNALVEMYRASLPASVLRRPLEFSVDCMVACHEDATSTAVKSEPTCSPNSATSPRAASIFDRTDGRTTTATSPTSISADLATSPSSPVTVRATSPTCSESQPISQTTPPAVPAGSNSECATHRPKTPTTSTSSAEDASFALSDDKIAEPMEDDFNLVKPSGLLPPPQPLSGLGSEVRLLRSGLACAYQEILATREHLDVVIQTTERLEMDVDMLRNGLNFVYVNYADVVRRREVRIEETFDGIPLLLLFRQKVIGGEPHVGFFIGLEKFSGLKFSPLKREITLRAHSLSGKVIEEQTLKTFSLGRIIHPCFDLSQCSVGNSLFGYKDFLSKSQIIESNALRNGILCFSVELEPLSEP